MIKLKCNFDSALGHAHIGLSDSARYARRKLAASPFRAFLSLIVINVLSQPIVSWRIARVVFVLKHVLLPFVIDHAFHDIFAIRLLGARSTLALNAIVS